MFIEIDDYKTVCSSRELEILQQSDTLTRERAERAALEEVASYLRVRYDVDKAYAASGDARNAFLVQMCVNVVLYYLVQWLPSKMALGNREKLYEVAIARLKDIQAGKSSPTLPSYTDANGQQGEGFPMVAGSMERQTYDW